MTLPDAPRAALAELTTLRVGGPAHRLVDAVDEAALVDAVREAWSSGEEWLVMGGGSNLLVGDEGFDGTVIRALGSGIERLPSEPGRVLLRVQAGHSWDALVAETVTAGYAGLEALSGIPGSVGAAPVQNIGAYGRELGDVLVAVDVFDLGTGTVLRRPAADLALGYRTSAFKRGDRSVVVAVLFELAATADGEVAYPQLADALGVDLGARMPTRDIRDAVLRLRAGKGMLLDEDDPDTWSAGSFFTNPIVSEHVARALPADAPRWALAPNAVAPAVTPLDALAAGAQVRLPPRGGEPAPVKLSAAWLIEHAGVGRGFRLPGSRAAVSSKHTLALTNRGGASAEEIAQLARYVQVRVLAEFGVLLEPEPVLVGVEL